MMTEQRYVAYTEEQIKLVIEHLSGAPFNQLCLRDISERTQVVNMLANGGQSVQAITGPRAVDTK